MGDESDDRQELTNSSNYDPMPEYMRCAPSTPTWTPFPPHSLTIQTPNNGTTSQIIDESQLAATKTKNLLGHMRFCKFDPC